MYSINRWIRSDQVNFTAQVWKTIHEVFLLILGHVQICRPFRAFPLSRLFFQPTGYHLCESSHSIYKLCSLFVPVNVHGLISSYFDLHTITNYFSFHPLSFNIRCILLTFTAGTVETYLRLNHNAYSRLLLLTNALNTPPRCASALPFFIRKPHCIRS